jgi:fructose-1,6-bisphosphatase/inositol monophosphatase family enzyme
MTSRKESFMKYTQSDITEEFVDSLVKKIEDIFSELGPEIIKNAGTKDFKIKQDGSPVTKFDSLIENKIVNKIKEDFPSLDVYGEEAGYSEEFPEVCLLIDPIDGTRSFIENIPTFTNMAVLLVNNEAIASVIYNPSNMKMFTAVKNKGAYLNKAKLNLNHYKMPNVVISKSKHKEVVDEVLKSEKIIVDKAPSGAGDGFSKVAEGLTAARFQINAGGYIHDYAPGALLVKEAGGEIISLDTEKYSIKSRSFIACHPKIKDVIGPNIKELVRYKDGL